ncbi:4,5-DOPA-extradiol-dioxygenase [Wenyingzhuangia sp. IMCC45574]
MNRKNFIKQATASIITLPFMKLNALSSLKDNLKSTPKMPLLFVGHGSPMNAIVQNQFHKKWQILGKSLPNPKAILVVSAHWLTEKKTKVTAMKTPQTIHDFGGFPEELFNQQYPAPGSPEMAQLTIDEIHSTIVHKDMDWGLDHGTWSVLKPMFPTANIPVFQISIDSTKPMEFHYNLGKELNTLRKKGVLIIGSGNIVHNLKKLNSENPIYDWAQEFDQKIKGFIDQRDFTSVLDFQKLGNLAQLAHPTYDHLLPLLYTLGAMDKDENLAYFNDEFDMGSISMRSLLINS